MLAPVARVPGVVVVLEDITDKKRMMGTLSRYMSPAVANQLVKEGGSKLGGVRQKVSVLFSDIRSFSSISEGRDAAEACRPTPPHPAAPRGFGGHASTWPPTAATRLLPRVSLCRRPRSRANLSAAPVPVPVRCLLCSAVLCSAFRSWTC